MGFNVNPVICFFENERYIYSLDYDVLSCPADVDLTLFLKQIELKFLDQMKIVQVDFESYSAQATSLHRNLYAGEKAHVFILHSYSIMTIREIKIKHANLLRSDDQFLQAIPFKLITTRDQFITDVDEIIRLIKTGRFYQMNLTSAFEAQCAMPALQFFLQAFDQFTGHYKSFLPLPTHSILSFSPELFLEKKQSTLKTQPIKGSVSKTENTTTALMKNEKEEAELSMIVDLLRNDLNSLEISNSAVVTAHRQLMNLSYIHHTFSEIKIQTQHTLPTILQRMMPGGSISGCPKKESLIAIGEFETHNRQAYTGTIGWWKNNDFILNIAIRTFVQSKDRYFYYAGCGIVHDSIPEKEFEELCNKAGNLNVSYK